MSYNPRSQIFVPMNDLEKDRFVRVLITRNIYHKVGSCLFWFVKQVLGDNSPRIALVSSCLVNRGTNYRLFLAVFPSMFLQQIDLEDRVAPCGAGSESRCFPLEQKPPDLLTAHYKIFKFPKPRVSVVIQATVCAHSPVSLSLAPAGSGREGVSRGTNAGGKLMLLAVP